MKKKVLYHNNSQKFYYSHEQSFDSKITKSPTIYSTTKTKLDNRSLFFDTMYEFFHRNKKLLDNNINSIDKDKNKNFKTTTIDNLKKHRSKIPNIQIFNNFNKKKYFPLINKKHNSEIFYDNKNY